MIWRLPRIPGHLLAGAGMALGIHGIIATTGLYATYDGQALANTLAAHEADGLAVINAEYNAEINFLARLTTHVALTPDSAKPDRLGAGSPKWRDLWPRKRKPADGSAAAGFPFLRARLGPVAGHHGYFSGINPFGLNRSTNSNTTPSVTRPQMRGGIDQMRFQRARRQRMVR